MRPILVKKGGREWDKVAEFYARWFAKKRAPDYSDAEAASEELANDLLGVSSADGILCTPRRPVSSWIEVRRHLMRSTKHPAQSSGPPYQFCP